MFKLSENYEVERKILEYDYLNFSHTETSTIITPNSEINVNIPREVSVISLLIGSPDLNFEVIKKADINRYANDSDIKLVFMGPIAIFSNFKLKTPQIIVTLTSFL